MIKVAFLGSKPIGYECLSYLIKNKQILNIEIAGIFTNDNIKLGSVSLTQLANENDISVFDGLEDLEELNIDFIISVQYHKILKKKHIASAKIAAINLHMAPLPEYRGCNQFSFAIIDNAKEFGTSFHLMSEGIDSGDLLFEKRFPVPDDCWVKELYDLTYQASLELFKERIAKIFQQKYKHIQQKDLEKTRGCSIHYRKEIERLKVLDFGWDIDKIYRHIRATSMPGFEPPYFLIDEKKFYITSK